MELKFVVDEDFVNYKKPSMFIGFPTCDWKCEKLCGEIGICQNCGLADTPTFTVYPEQLVDRYVDNPISHALVIGGLEPFDSWDDLCALVGVFRNRTDDDIVIYTGYYDSEISDEIEYLRQNYDNIVVKFGRFVPHQKSHLDEVLGVKLSSDNQFAERIC